MTLEDVKLSIDEMDNTFYNLRDEEIKIDERENKDEENIK